MKNLVAKNLEGCKTCQLFTPKTKEEPVAAERTNTGGWEEVSIDLFGPLPDKKHVLVVQDTMSRFPAAAIVQNTAGRPVVKALDNIYTSYGMTEFHSTDNGPPFNSEHFERYSTYKGIKHIKSYPHHPQGNACETFMKPLGKTLKAAYFNRDNAQHALDELLKAYRTTPHPATKAAPGDLLFMCGYHSDFPWRPDIEDAMEEATLHDRTQKQERNLRLNSSTKRVP